MTTTTTVAGVRAWARGMYTTEAAVELLIRRGYIRENAPWTVQRGDGKVAVDFDVLAESSGEWSGGERALVGIAVALVDDEWPVALGSAVARLDRQDVELVLAAIAHTSGSHDHGGFKYDDTGKPIGLIRHESLYSWPETAVEDTGL